MSKLSPEPQHPGHDVSEEVQNEYYARWNEWSREKHARLRADAEAKCPNTWAKANAQLTGRNKDSRKIARNTYLQRRPGNDIAVKLHSTDVVTFHPDGSFTLSMGGWPTMTTRDRIDGFTPKWLRMYSERGVQKVRVNMKGTGWGDGVTYRHFDGITFGPRGGCRNPMPEAKKAKLDTEKDKLDKAIKKFADGFVKAARAGNVPMPSGGDCWHCCMRTADGTPMGELGDDPTHEHLLSHIGLGPEGKDEIYYVPSLMVNAMRDKGYSDSGISVWMNMDPANDRIGAEMYGRPWDAKTAKAALVAYLRKRLVTGVATGRMVEERR